MTGLLVHDWLSKVGGSELVFDAIVDLHPDARLMTLWNDDPETRYPGRPVAESWIARTPLRRSKAAALPFMPTTWRRPDLDDVDWILASSHLFAHQVRVRSRPDVPKFAYVYTPARYIWTPDLDTRGRTPLARLASPVLRRLDRARARELTAVAAISEYVRARVQRTWGVDATVIYPPVDVEALRVDGTWADRLDDAGRAVLDALPPDFLLAASRFVPYKRIDAAIDFAAAVDRPLVVAGAGSDAARLRARAQDSTAQVMFVDAPSNALLRALYERAELFVFLALEDFGIMPVEAMALGTPVVVRAEGGAAETVVDGVTGAHLADLDSPADARRAYERAMAVDADECRRRAHAFSTERFSAELMAWLERSRVEARR